MKQNFRTVALALVFCVVLTLLAYAGVPTIHAVPADVTLMQTSGGSCGEGVYWEYFEDTRTLKVHGSGAVTSPVLTSDNADATSILVGSEITSICKGAFRGFNSLEEITLPFIGKSATATSYEAVLGYIFGYESAWVDGMELALVSGTKNYYSSAIDIATSDGKTTFGAARLMYRADYVSAALEVLAGETGTFILKTSGESRTFRNCYWYSDYKKIPAESTTWQYSANDHYGNFYMDMLSNERWGYFMQSYYYYIPATLKIVNITKATSVPMAAFNGCSHIETINYYAPVESVGYYAYQNCNAVIHDLYDSYSGSFIYTNDIDTFTYSLQNGNAVITGCTTSNEAVTVPDMVDGYPVTAIGYRAFAENTAIKSVILPITVSCVKPYAFYGCENLENVTLSTSLSEIGEYAFSGTALTRVTFPGSLCTIGGYAYANCPELKTVTMRSGVESLGEGAFYNAEKLTSVKLSDTVTQIGELAFYNCAALTEIVLPASVEQVGNCAFENCTALSSVTVNGDLTYIGKKAFYSCNVASFHFGNALTYLGADAFSATPIQSVTLPNTTKVICDQAFSDCQMLKALSVPDSVVIGTNALHNNAIDLTVTVRYNTGTVADKLLFGNQMHGVVLEEGITEIGKYAFAQCGGLVNISLPGTLKKIDDYAFFGSKLSTRMQLPENVNQIGDYAFAQASALTQIEIPDTVRSIGDGAFESKVGVTVYYRLGVISTGLFDGQAVESIYIEDDIYWIEENAFANCTDLTDVSLPDTVSYVGKNCFLASDLTVLTIRTVDGYIDDELFDGKLSSIETVNLDNSNIGQHAFANNPSVKNLNIEAKSELAEMTVLGEHAFDGCAELEKIVLPETVTHIGAYAFYGCSKLASVNIPVDVSAIESYTFYNCSSLQCLSIPENVQSIEEYAFFGCESMDAVNIPNGVSSIAPYTFYGCGSLEALEFPESVSSIGDYACYGCTALLSANIPERCVSIGNHAFYNCKAITMTDIPDAVSTIGRFAFASCANLRKIILGNSVSSLGEGAFYNCTKLQIVETGEKLTSLNNQVFGGCYNLEKIYIYAPCTYIDDYAFYGSEGVTAYIGNDAYMIDYFESNAIEYVILDQIVYEYLITFLDDNGNILSSNLYTSGSEVTEPVVPSKEANLTYTYEFAGWDKKITVANSHTTYTAVFTPVFIDYEVTFRNEDGSVISVRSYHYGDSVNVPADPTKTSDNTYTYSFVGWDKEVSAVTENVTYTAVYQKEHIVYTVVFLNEDGSVLTEELCHYSDAVNIPTAQSKLPDERYSYVFTGWDPEVSPVCTANAVYQAVYRAVEHLYAEVVIPANCQEGGYTVHSCTECGFSYTDTYTEATGHRYVGVVTEPTATEQGYTTYTCTQCGDTYVSDHTEPLGEPRTVSFSVPEGAAAIADMSCDNRGIRLPEANVPGGTLGYIFAGWFTEAVDKTASVPKLYLAGSTFYAEKSMVLYAVYACMPTGESDGQWTLVTDTSFLKPGIQLILASSDHSATAGQMNGAYLSSVAASFADGGALITEISSETIVFTLGGTEEEWTLGNAEGQLMGATAVKKLAWDKGTTTWSIRIEDGFATLSNTNSDYGRFLYNFSSLRFTTYTSAAAGFGQLPRLYSREPVYYTSVIERECTHEGEMELRDQKSPDHLSDGYTGDLYCMECGELLEQGTVISNNPFPDVGENNSFKTYILWNYYKGIIGGDKQGNFNPEKTVTRGQFIIMLWRAAGKPEPTQFKAFPDVSENSSFYKAVCWAVEKNITNGQKDGTFGVNQECTRGHVALFLYRYAGTPEVHSKVSFPDVTGGTYYKAVCWMVEKGITNGQKDGTFGVGNACKRTHVTKFLYLYLNEA